MAHRTEGGRCMTVMFDTCALIALTNCNDEFHDIAERCYRELVKGKHRMLVSVISVAEYGVKGELSDIAKLSFLVPVFGMQHAAKAAQFANVTKNIHREQQYDRQFIAADTQIIAQAEVEQVDCILTRDVRTFARTTYALKEKKLISLEIIRLDGDPLFQMGLDQQRSFPADSLASRSAE